jgi:predicted dehydrogenase
MNQYRVALIGTGNFANAHVEALHSAGERVALVAAVNKDSERGRAFCQQHAIPAFYSNTPDMLNAVRPDLVVICTPPGTHVELCMQSLEAGAHVLCEKPLCGSLAEFDQLQLAEVRAGRWLSNVFQWRFGSAAQHVHRLIQAETFGELRLINCLTLWHRDQSYYSVPWRGKRELALGGSSLGHGIHLMDLMLYLISDWQDVQALVGTFDYPMDVENLSLALVRFASGGMASIVNSTVSPRQETHLRLDFQRATVEVKGLYGYTNDHWLYTPLSADEAAPWPPADDFPGALSSQIVALLDSLDAGQRPLVSGAEARRILEFLTCLYKSAATGERIARGSIAPDDPFYHSLMGHV